MAAERSLREAEVGASQQARAQIPRQVPCSFPRCPRADSSGPLPSGDTPQAQTMADELSRSAPANILANCYWLPTIRATVELSRHRPENAIRLLQSASPCELGEPNPQAQIAGTLYPAYVRGEAYLANGNAQPAVAEFQNSLTIAAWCRISYWGLGALQLGRAYFAAAILQKPMSSIRISSRFGKTPTLTSQS